MKPIYGQKFRNHKLSFELLLTSDFLKYKIDNKQIGKKNKHQNINATVPPLP